MKEDNVINEVDLDDIILREMTPTPEFDVNKLRFPIINVRRTANLSESIIGYFALSAGFFIYAMLGLDWFKSTQNIDFVKSYFLYAGIVLLITSLYEWYQGRTLLFSCNFIFGILFIFFYLQGNPNENKEIDKIEAIMYIFIFAFIFFVILASKEKGILIIIDYIVLFTGMVLQFIIAYWRDYKKIKTIMDVRNYDFIVIAGLLWLTGIIKLYSDLSDFTLGFVEA